jgi:hypothetical protein
MKITKFLILLVIVAFVSSCQYKTIDIEPVIIVEDLSFSDDVIPIFDRGCNMTGCHSVGSVPPDLTFANAYGSLFATGQIDTVSPATSLLYLKMHTGSMSSFTEVGESDIILKWIEQGAKNN